MTLLKNPTKELQRPLSAFRKGIEKAINRTWHAVERSPLSVFNDFSTWPAIHVAEDEKNLTLRVDVPGLRAKDLEVEVSGDLLTIRGQREEEWNDQKRGGSYRHERFAGSFSRTITLPSYVNADKIDAKYDQGVLVITVAKVPGAGPKRVAIRSS